MQDLRHALRLLRRSPGFTFIAVFTLALALGAVTAIFSVVYGVLLRPLPYSEPSRILSLWEVNTQGSWSRLADPNFDDFTSQNHSFQSLAKYAQYPATVIGASEPVSANIGVVSSGFFSVLRVQPILGRAFRASDAQKGAAPVVLLSHAYWQEHLASSPSLSNVHLKIEDSVYSVVGVLPASFDFPAQTALWIPADLEGENQSRTSHNCSAIVRLRDGVTLAQAKADISAIARRIRATSSEQNDYLLKDAIVVPLQDSLTRRTRPVLLILLGAVGFLLLVACANVANLLLAQSAARERELSVRSALGAGRGRIIRQFLTESLVLSVAGGGLGILAAFFGVDALLSLAPPNLPRLSDIALNFPVLVFAFTLCGLVAVGLGVFTALRATSPNKRLHTGFRTTQRASHTIVAAQIAVTLILVVGAGLLGRSLMNVLSVSPGFRIDQIVTMDVSLPGSDPSAKSQRVQFFANLLDRLQQIPGVRKVGATSGIPMNNSGGLPDGMFLLMTQDELPKTPPTDEEAGRLFESFARQKARVGHADFGVTTEGYFQTLGIPLLRGRLFNDRDTINAPHVAVISQSLARKRWPHEDPIGHTIEFGNMDGDMRLLTIVGIVADVHEYGLDAPPEPTVYVDLMQRPRADMTITLLTAADTEQVTSAAREILRQLNPEIPAKFNTFPAIYSASLGSRRFNLILMGFFAAVALLLAGAGVFGVMAYSVSRRTREIGVRVALGAQPSNVLAMVLANGLRTALIGIAIGIAGSLALTRALSSLLFGVKPNDPITFAAVIVLILFAALLACYLPARRAARVDPAIALRYD